MGGVSLIMRIRVGPSTWAWEPVTPRGVAAFAGAPLGRLLLVQGIVAGLAAVTVVWFLQSVWFPTVERSLRALPEKGEVREGKLRWRGDSPTRLAGDRFLALVVDLDHEADLGHEADVCVEFGQRDVRLLSLLGYVDLAYPPDWVVAANRSELKPWWGAWRPVILAAMGGAVVVGLEALWCVLASVYCLPVWLVAFFANRELKLRQAWRLAAAALMPGALIMNAAVFFYGVGLLDLVRFGLCVALHFLVGWIYLFVSPLFLPGEAAARAVKGNPFAPPNPARGSKDVARP